MGEQSFNGTCTGSDWNNYVKPFLESTQNPVPIYSDINNCHQPACLADFFPISSAAPRTFVGIPVDPLRGQSYFQNYFSVNHNETPDGPDADDD